VATCIYASRRTKHPIEQEIYQLCILQFFESLK
jgi:hypothetical protein